MEIIELAGKIGSGKDTVSSELIKFGYEQFIFAEPIKQFFSFSLGLTRAEAEQKSMHIDELNFTLRQLYQFFGTELIRNQIHNDFWIISVAKRIRKENAEKIVISDTRFPNEKYKLQEYLPEAHVKTVNVVREVKVDDEYLGFENHPSETSIDEIDFDYQIDNNGSIEELKEKVSEMLNYFDF